MNKSTEMIRDDSNLLGLKLIVTLTETLKNIRQTKNGKHVQLYVDSSRVKI
jgi:hypothetical protein